MPNPQPQKRLHKLQKGQSLVEMALGLVVLLLILSGLLDFGRIYFTYLALEDAAGEAALFLSINPDCPKASSGANCADPNNAEWRARHAVGEGLVDWDRLVIKDPIVQGDPGGGFYVGSRVTVELTYPHRLLSPFVPNYTGVNPIVLTTRATQTVITNGS